MIKKLLKIGLAVCIAAGIPISAVHADDPEPAAPTTIITAECRRIIDDNKFFEISLNANTQEKELSGISMVLQYDASLLVPVTWDGEDIDMTRSKTWKARMAMPTLSLETWNSSTALTYVDSETNIGYLFLSAEYHGRDKSISDNPGDTPANPAAPDTGQTVVARFRYVDDTSQKTIVDAWNEDWSLNPVISIATDEVALASPAQYPVGIYYADNTFMAYAADPATAKLKAENGEVAAKTDFDVTLTLGKSAKAGGLTLNDVSAILFFDWDDSFMGAVTVMKEGDARAQINDFVDSTFVHTDLQGQTGDDLASTARAMNYRGEEPYNEPNIGGGDTADDGASYPLTNKLDYIFYGKTLDEDGYGYVSGWKQVEPLTMSEEWTALSTGDTPETYDFSNIDANVVYVKALYYPGDGLDKTTTGGRFVYYTLTDSELTSMDIANEEEGTYGINFTAKRINQYGYGVTRLLQPVIRMKITPYTDIDAKKVGPELTMQLTVDKSDTASVQLTPVRQVARISYQLLDLENDKYNVVSGQARSVNVSINSLGKEGFIYLGTLNKIISALEDYANGDEDAWDDIDYQAIIDVNIKYQAKGTEFKNSTWKTAKKKIAPLAEDWLKDDGKITWEHIQWSILNKYKTTDFDTCKSYCQGLDWY